VLVAVFFQFNYLLGQAIIKKQFGYRDPSVYLIYFFRVKEGVNIYLTESFSPLTNLARWVGPRVVGEADSHVGGEEVLLEHLDLPIDLLSISPTFYDQFYFADFRLMYKKVLVKVW